MSALPNQLVIDDEAEDRATLIEDLEKMQPQTALGQALIRLRLEMLRTGQKLFSLDEINRELGREEKADLH